MAKMFLRVSLKLFWLLELLEGVKKVFLLDVLELNHLKVLVQEWKRHYNDIGGLSLSMVVL